MTSLVEKLSQGEHAVSLIRYKDVADVKTAVERGFVLVKFTGTQGGTEIGMSLDKKTRVDLSGSRVALCGSLTLDYQPVKCTVNVDLDTMTGHGCLEPVRAA